VIASVPQFVSHLNESAKGLPTRSGTAVQRPAPSQTEPSGTPPQAPAQASPRSPLTQEWSKPEQAEAALGSLQTRFGQTIGITPASQTEAFSRAWVNALEQSEATTAQRLRSTKGLVLPLAEPKPATQGPTNDSVSTSVFTNEKTESLPLVLSFNAQLPAGDGEKNAETVRGVPGSISGVGNEDPEETLVSAPGELAFTAKIKSQDAASDTTPAPSSNAIAKSITSTQTAELGLSALVSGGKADLGIPVISGYAANDPANPGTSINSSKILPSTPIESVDATQQAATSAPQPLKEIALQLPGARGVEVRLTEHAGEVHVDVRSGDAGLTQDLRDNLHDLVSGLERKGFSTEVSHVAEHAAAPASRSGDTGASKDQTPGDQSGAFDRQPQQRNRQPGQQPEPTNSKARGTAWTEQANSSFGKENQ
jgi:hypothetical protein